jgi:hypothetical protein
MKKLNYCILLLSIVAGFHRLSFGQGIIISSGAYLHNSNNYMVLTGNWINNGTFTDSGGTLIFTGTTQSLDGTSVAQFNNITVSSGSTTMIVTSGQTLSKILLSNGSLNANGNITLLSTAVQTSLIDGSGTGQINGNVIMQRYLPSGFGYKYFSSPFQAATVNEFGDDMDLGASFPSFYRYDESRTTSGWISYVNPTGVLNPMEGYAVNFGSSAVPITADVAGVVNNGSLSLTLYNNNNTYTLGFNLIGNPYPSPIDWDAPSGWTKTNIDDALYYFKASTTDQYGGTYSTYISGVSSDGLATNIIPSMQGFFVHVTDGSYPVTGTLGMDNSVRITDLTHAFIKSDNKSTKPLIRLTADFTDDSSPADPAVIYFDEKAGTRFDSKLDALKLTNTDLNVPNLYSISSDDNKLSINALPSPFKTPCVIPLGLKIYKSGSITFKIRDIDDEFPGQGIYLSDIVAGIEQDLLPNNEYRIYLEAGEYYNRFYLNLTSSPTDIPDIQTENDLFSIYSSKGILIANFNIFQGEKGLLQIHSLTGSTLFMYNIYQPGYHQFSPIIKDGIYIATFITGNRRESKKILILKR